MPSMPFSLCSQTSMSGLDEVGDERRQADAEVDVESRLLQLLGGGGGARRGGPGVGGRQADRSWGGPR